MKIRHLVTVTAATAVLALTGCAGDTLGALTAGHQQNITDTGTECSWEQEQRDGYTYATCGDDLVLVVSDDPGVLDQWESDGRARLGHGFVVRADTAVGFATGTGGADHLARGLDAEPEPF